MGVGGCGWVGVGGWVWVGGCGVLQRDASYDATSLKDANEKVVQDMINCVENKRKGDAPGEARTWMSEILRKSGPTNNFHLYVNSPSNQVVEVENIFEGQTGDGTKWTMRFIINADFPNEKLNQKAHFGCEVHWNTVPLLISHKWFKDGVLQVGRPTDRRVQLEEFETGRDEKKFDNKLITTLVIVIKIDKQNDISIPLTTTLTTIVNENRTNISKIKDLLTYHFIIVSCGTSGAVLASRLSENRNFRVICIEKGPDDFPNDSEWNGMKIPNDFHFLSPHDPIIITNRQKILNKLVYIPRSIGLGGTSRIYGMINSRASPELLKQWPLGWQYEQFLSYYKKLEDHYCYYTLTNISKEDCEFYHGKSGPMKVNSLNPLLFHNLTYLTSDVLKRPNLSILIHSTVTRILFDDTNRAIGIEYYDSKSQTIKTIYSLYEIILSAGAFSTPHLLQISGIGDPIHLQKINIKPIVNNTYVGRNLADHISLPYIIQLKNCDEDFYDINGPFSWLIQFNSGIRLNQSRNIRDIQIYFLDTNDSRFTYTNKLCSELKTNQCTNGTIATLRITLQINDFTSGMIKAQTNSIFDKPEIDLNWIKLSENDKNIFSKVINLLRSFTMNKSSEFGQLISQEILPGNLNFDEYFQYIESALHPTCSCQMGFCTDENLIVKGTKSLRVCDASSFASQIDANPSATIYAMAEILSDKLIKQYSKNQQIGIWKQRHTMFIFQSYDLISTSKIAAFDFDKILMNKSQQLQNLFLSGYKIIIFMNEIHLGFLNNNLLLEWQLSIEMFVMTLQIPVQIFISTSNDEYHKPEIKMWKDFIWLFNDGKNIDYKSSFYVSKSNPENFTDINSQFAANIPLSYYSFEQQFAFNKTMKHFNVIQTIRIGNTVGIVWNLIGRFFYIHKWHPNISMTDQIDEQTRRISFNGHIIGDSIEQLEILDNQKREYQFRNIGGNFGKLIENYQSKLSVIEDDNGRSSIVLWSCSFDSHYDFITDFYRIGLDSVNSLLSSNTFTCSSFYNNYDFTIYWRQEYNINATHLWKYIDISNENLLFYDPINYEIISCMKMKEINYISKTKIVSTGSTSSAWIRTGQIIMNNYRTANHILTNIFVVEGEKLRQQLL
ncbi:hypothetical protein I4U23_022397 [Adineta vaga]|nr:hypothetical protein I4U23_022397 [Adineta vaga]